MRCLSAEEWRLDVLLAVNVPLYLRISDSLLMNLSTVFLSFSVMSLLWLPPRWYLGYQAVNRGTLDVCHV